MDLVLDDSGSISLALQFPLLVNHFVRLHLMFTLCCPNIFLSGMTQAHF